MRRRHAIAALALAASVAAPAALAEPAEGGTLERFEDAPRPYLVYTPPGGDDVERPLVVYLHGCNQDAQDAFVGTRLAEHADEGGFVVLLPEQTTAANGARCWNWFLPENQARGSGGAAILADITTAVTATYDIDPARVFVIGASAGGVMTVNLGATYPDLFRAIGVLAGCPYDSCADATGAPTFEAMGPYARAVPTFVANGTADPAVPYPQARDVVSEWLGVADLADDGALNATVSRQPATIEHDGFDQTPQPGSGDPCLPDGGPTRLPCAGGVAGFDGSYPYTVERWTGEAGGPVLVELWTVHGASHAIVGGDPRGSFTDPLGPDIVGAALAFFDRV